MIQFGMPTLIENSSIEDNVALCRSLGLSFVELNMNFPEYEDKDGVKYHIWCAEEAGKETEMI